MPWSVRFGDKEAPLSVTPHKASLEDLFFQEAAPEASRVQVDNFSGRAL